MMWILIIIVTTGAIETGATLERYTTERQCNIEKIRVERLMKAEYPKDHDFRLFCKYAEKVV